jgi:hypothetical protein
MIKEDLLETLRKRIIQTNKGLNEDLSNIDILSDDEWNFLIADLLPNVTAGGIPAISIGICSLKYLHDISPQRFNDSIVSIMLEENSVNLDDSWDYNNLLMMMEICGCSSIKDFLNLGMNSSEVEVSESAKDYLNTNPKNENWYKFYLNDYKKGLQYVKILER